MKAKRILLWLTCVGILLAFSGCWFAFDGEGSETHRLAGVLITMEPLSSFIPEDPNRVFGSVNKMLAEMHSLERIYAEHVVTFHTDPETGDEFQRDDFIFPGVEGIRYFVARIYVAEEATYATFGDSGINITHTGLSFGDNSFEIQLEGTVHMVPGQMRYGAIINPVYQTYDGRVFTERGSGFSVHYDSDDGSVFTQTLAQSTSVTVRGVETTESAAITINVSSMRQPEKFVFLQMDADSQVISRSEFAINKVPEQLQMESLAEFLIVETHRPSASHEQVIRELHTTTDERIPTFHPRPDGIMEAHWTEIVWVR